jgi:hypothetical protein
VQQVRQIKEEIQDTKQKVMNINDAPMMRSSINFGALSNNNNNSNEDGGGSG